LDNPLQAGLCVDDKSHPSPCMHACLSVAACGMLVLLCARVLLVRQIAVRVRTPSSRRAKRGRCTCILCMRRAGPRRPLLRSCQAGQVYMYMSSLRSAGFPSCMLLCGTRRDVCGTYPPTVGRGRPAAFNIHAVAVVVRAWRYTPLRLLRCAWVSSVVHTRERRLPENIVEFEC
jgi:hypothetical protein